MQVDGTRYGHMAVPPSSHLSPELSHLMKLKLYLLDTPQTPLPTPAPGNSPLLFVFMTLTTLGMWKWTPYLPYCDQLISFSTLSLRLIHTVAYPLLLKAQ